MKVAMFHRRWIAVIVWKRFSSEVKVINTCTKRINRPACTAMRPNRNWPTQEILYPGTVGSRTPYPLIHSLSNILTISAFSECQSTMYRRSAQVNCYLLAGCPLHIRSFLNGYVILSVSIPSVSYQLSIKLHAIRTHLPTPPRWKTRFSSLPPSGYSLLKEGDVGTLQLIPLL